MASPALDGFLRELVEHGVMSAAVGLVADHRQVFWRAAAGESRAGVAASTSTRFDYASLTKPFAATLALVLDRAGVLPLELRLGDLFARADPRLARCTLESLLRHRAGFQAWAPLAASASTSREARAQLLDGRFLGAPPGTYSDLGYVLWGFAVELATGRPWTDLLRERVLRRLGIRGVAPRPGRRRDIAECRCGNGREVDLARQRGVRLVERRLTLCGEPQDGNARFVGRPAAHAGLFGPAESAWRLAAEWLRPRRLLTGAQVEAALAGPRGPYALGWARRRSRGTAGPALDASAFGIAPFVGGSLWIDPRRGLAAVLLAHRLDARANLKPWRQRFNRLAVEAFG